MPLLQQVLEQYPNDVKVVAKNYPIRSHKFARAASVAALAAGEQGQYWEYHEKIFGDYRNLSDQKFLDFAKELGLNMGDFITSLKDPKHQKFIAKDLQEAALLGVTGTPTIFINGIRLRNRSIEGFKAIIDAELRKKK